MPRSARPPVIETIGRGGFFTEIEISFEAAEKLEAM